MDWVSTCVDHRQTFSRVGQYQFSTYFLRRLGFFFCETPFHRFFVTSHDISQKKTDRHFFVCARLRVASNLYEYATNNCNICYLAIAPTLRANQLEFKDRGARLNRFHTYKAVQRAPKIRWGWQVSALDGGKVLHWCYTGVWLKLVFYLGFIYLLYCTLW